MQMEDAKPEDSYKSIMSGEDSSSNNKDRFVDEERSSSSPVVHPVTIEHGNTESESCLRKIENHDACTESSQLDCLSHVSNDIHSGKDESSANTHIINRSTHKEVKNDVVVDKILNGISLSTSKGGDETKNVLINSCRHRAGALEALLELCAQLLMQGKLEELAAVLRPFGEDTVSSPETTIWLTKSLLSSQKFNPET